MLNLLIALIGGLFLYGGAEGLVRATKRLSRAFHIPEYVIGCTLVALATSMPELITTLLSQGMGLSGDVAVGNIVGSNIANIGLILGIGLLIRPIESVKGILKVEIPFQLIMYALLFFVLISGSLYVGKGLILAVGLALYLAYQYRTAQRGKPREVSERSFGFDLLLFALSVIALVVGARFLLHGGVSLAQMLGVSDRVIGLTLIAFGSSLPELAAVVVASYRGRESLVLGNVLGSNIFNPLLILPLAALVRPLSFSSFFAFRDLPIALGLTVVLGLFSLKGRLGRGAGVTLIVLYGAWLVRIYLVQGAL